MAIKEAVSSRQMHFVIRFTSLQKNIYTSNWLSNFSTNNMRVYNPKFKNWRKKFIVNVL